MHLLHKPLFLKSTSGKK